MKPLILDCDPGHDDMAAIILAACSEELELLGITAVAGNQTVDKTYKNARAVCTLVGRSDIPVFRGCSTPLVRDLVTAPHIHGKSGLDGSTLPEPEGVEPKLHAVDWLRKTLAGSGEPVTLIATGPLTNVAMLMIQEPGVKKKISNLVIMGGGHTQSNITPAAEFNIYVDPEAADVVFRSGLPITQVTLDVTNTAVFTDKDIDRIQSAGNPVADTVAPLLRYFSDANKRQFGMAGAPLHDPVTVAYTIDPKVIKTEHYNVEIETKSELTRGRTVIDIHRVTGRKPNADVSVAIDLEYFKEMIFESLQARPIR